jgi:hypothetical protein
MKIRSLAIAATALFLPFTAVAGGDSGDDKPDAADIKSELTKAGMPEEQADCVTKALDDAGLTYDDYTKVSEDSGSVADDPKFKEYIAEAVKCFTNGTDISIPDLGN